ncbi:Piso0_003258 [Millerozyma farinosa CBS 7064]|uniref:Piso0_003258 protein n=1 Tax=Pichia sorbitophila (strain ATCC MYA-4447 / BCRC 22081 / CBS 7064 / NBRC 10061 / NRRL Y-12695) TaxID=559304 RepID=G8YIL1_PICSO|nr:Piso0_003258 [Millerozyma farinosa CBS 7064]CCE80921.1 Piso0_003258 [Millerozyma farinosa CBS 7064]
MPPAYPKAIVFDLDYTLWPCWCDTHISMPLKFISHSEVEDSYGMRLRLYKDVEMIIKELKDNDVYIISASRTATPYIAKELLQRFHVSGRPLIEFFDSMQWGQGSKVKHITKAAKELKLESSLEKGEFILFDDEYRNRDVLSINCEFAHVDERKGLDRKVFEKALKIWHHNHKN